MKRHYFGTVPVITLAALLTACASTPPESPALNETKAAYDAAVDDPEIARNGLSHLRDANAALDRAEALRAEGGKEEAMGHQIYLANRHLELAREQSLRSELQEELREAERRRDDLRIRIGDRRAQEAELQARMLREQMDRLEAEQTDRGMVMTLGDVLFDIDKSDLKPGGERTVRKLSDFLREYPGYRVRVEGYTDSTGEASYNQELSLRRAQSVQNQLLEDGISSDRVEVQGLGEDYPKATNTTSAGRQENRRVEIVISDRDGNIGSR